jgi:hypothetical protein
MNGSLADAPQLLDAKSVERIEKVAVGQGTARGREETSDFAG